MIDFKIKICGITTATDAKRASEFGADAIGLNFYSKSMRSITVERAKEISSSIPRNSKPKWVGVFVNENAAAINQIAKSAGLDFVQLHGDESADIVTQIQHPIIRAIRVLDVDFAPAVEEIDAWLNAGVAAVLLDKGSSTQYGGTGETLDWESVSKLKIRVPIILAGGLQANSVAQAISVAKPDAVDVASGVEKFPGSKDEKMMQDFISQASKQFSIEQTG